MSALFIILVGLMMTWYDEKMSISNRWIRCLMPNLIKKSWTVSTLVLSIACSLYYVVVLLHSNLHQQAPVHSNLKCIFLLAMAHIGVKDFFRKWKFQFFTQNPQSFYQTFSKTFPWDVVNFSESIREKELFVLLG